MLNSRTFWIRFWLSRFGNFAVRKWDDLQILKVGLQFWNYLLIPVPTRWRNLKESWPFPIIFLFLAKIYIFKFWKLTCRFLLVNILEFLFKLGRSTLYAWILFKEYIRPQVLPNKDFRVISLRTTLTARHCPL